MPSGPKHILIVEDDPGLAMLFGDKLRHAGYTCAAVDSAKTCLAWLATQSSDLMLLDYSLPDLLAPALVERLRHAGRLPPFIVVTGHGDERVAVEMMKLGARDYLVKDNLLFDRMPAVVDRTLREVEKEQRLAASEAALKQSESLYHDLVETSQDLIWQCDAEGRYTYLNPAWEQVFGYKIEEMLGRKFSEFQHPEAAARDQAVFARLLQGGVVHGHETVHLGKAGNEIHLIFNAKHLPAASGAPGGTRGTAFDNTERKQAAAALRQSEERLRITLETTHIGIWDWDLTKDEWVASATYFTMLGYPPVTGPASRSEWLDRLHPEDRPLVAARIADVLQGTKDKYEYEARTRRADGTYCWQQVRGDVVAHDPSGRATRLVGTRMDITERKQAEEDLEQFFALVPDMVCIASGDGFFRKLNDEWVRVLGSSKEELMAVPFIEFIHPEDRAATRHESAQQAAGNSTARFVNRYRAKDGTFRWLEWNATATNSKGILFAAARDITEHRQAEEAVRESELRYRTLANSGPGLVWTSGLDRKCDYFNQTWLNFTGRSLEQELGDGWVEGVHPDDLERCVATYVTAFDRRERFSMDYRLRSRSGEYRWILDDGSPRHDSQGNFLGYIGHCLDITERKQSAAALRESERRFQTIFENSPAGVALVDLAGRYQMVNPAFSSIFGYTAEELQRIDFFTITHPDDLELSRRAIRETLESEGRRVQFTKRYFHKDGRTLWTEVSSELVSAADGTPEHFVTHIVDITERKRAEEALRESEEKFAKVFHDAPVWIAITDMADATYLDVNEAVLHAAGFTREEVIGHTAAGIGWITSEDRTRLVETIREHGRITSLEMAFRTKDGRLLQGLVSGEPISIGGRPRLLTVTIDITARKRAEDDRHRSHELLAKLAAQVPGVVYQYRLFPDGRSCFPYASPGMQDIYEYDPEDVRTDATPVFSRLHPEDAGSVSAAILESARTLAPFHCEFRVVLPRQGLRWRLSDAMPERTEDGGTLWYGIISDITDRRRAEAALHESLHEKEALLKEVHHRVKNNLQVISSLLRLEAGRVADPGTESVLRDMQNRIRTMALLHESLYRSGNLAEVDMKAYLETLCQQLFRAASARSSGPVELQVAVGPIRLELNRTVPCGLIVNELVSNCLKHAFPAGRGGRVRVELQPTSVPDEWGLSVGDNGVGLPAGFTLAHLPSLGLQLVSDLARQLQGRLEIAPPPAPSAGTVATVYLKALPPESRPAP